MLPVIPSETMLPMLCRLTGGVSSSQSQKCSETFGSDVLSRGRGFGWAGGKAGGEGRRDLGKRRTGGEVEGELERELGEQRDRDFGSWGGGEELGEVEVELGRKDGGQGEWDVGSWGGVQEEDSWGGGGEGSLER